MLYRSAIADAIILTNQPINSFVNFKADEYKLWTSEFFESVDDELLLSIPKDKPELLSAILYQEFPEVAKNYILFLLDKLNDDAVAQIDRDLKEKYSQDTIDFMYIESVLPTLSKTSLTI